MDVYGMAKNDEEFSSRAKRKWENRGFMAAKRCVLGRTGCFIFFYVILTFLPNVCMGKWQNCEEVMLMWQDLTCRPGGLIFFHAERRNRFCLLSRSNHPKLSKDMFQTDPLSREENMSRKCHKGWQISK